MPDDRLVLTPADLPPGTSSQDLFGRAAPLVLEIGVGGGGFLVELADDRPEWNLLGVDLSTPSVYRAFRKARRRAPDRIRLYRGDGRFVVRDALAPRSLRGVYVNFPDPWPKEEHAERRLLRGPFFREVAARLEPEGWLELTTDHETYFRSAVAEAETSDWFAVEERDPSDRALRTRYAEKWRAEDRSFYCARFQKRTHPGDLSPSTQLRDMQHAVLEGSLPVPDSFEKLVDVAPEAERTVVVMDAMKVAGRDKLLFAVRTEERYLVQEFLVEARSRPADGESDGADGSDASEAAGRMVLGVERFDRPLPTEAVARAVELLADWFEERGCAVLDRSY